MELNTKEKSLKLEKAKGITLNFTDKAKEGVLSVTDDALFLQKQKSVTKEDTETAAEALNAPTNVFLGARNRTASAKEKSLKMEKKADVFEGKLSKERKKLKTLNNKRNLKRQENLEAKRKLAIVKKSKYEKLSKKRISKGDIAKGIGVSAIGAIASESDEENKKNIEKAKRMSRMPGKVKRANRAAQKTVQGTYKTGVFLSSLGTKTAGAISSAIRAVSAIMTPIAIVVVIIIIIITALLVVFFGASEEENKSICPYGDMYYWIRWETGTWEPDEAFGMVLGDGGKAYGIQLDYRYGLIPFNRWCYDTNKNKYSALKPYTENGSVKLNDTTFASIWKSTYDKNKEDFAEKQKNYAKNNYYIPVETYLKNNGINLQGYSDVVKGAVLSFSWQHGVGAAKLQLSKCIPKKKTEDAEVIKNIYEKRMSLYPRFKSRYTEELEYALTLLNYGEMTGSNVIGTEMQKRIVFYAMSGNSFGQGHGYCQAWVRCVYTKATGVGNSGCCASACRDKWATKSGEIPVGAAIYSAPSYNSKVRCGCGRNAGHVGIYVGNNTVVSMLQKPTAQSLSKWNDWFGYGGWSWNGGRALN